MKIIERYSAAVNSDNLAVDPRSTWGDSDVLGAAGLAARYEPLGVALTRLFADGKPEQTIAILSEMAYGRSHYLRVKITRLQAADLSKAVLGWYRHGRCNECGGTGFGLIPGTPYLSECECSICKGTGKVLFDPMFTAEVLPLAKWIAAEIDRSQAAAGSTAMAFLAPRMEL